MTTAHTYSSAVEGGAPVCVRYTIAGRLHPATYLGFVAERAGWLDISGWAEAAADGTITLVAAGPEALVGALEMACLLGPLDALIASMDMSEEPGLISAGFHLRA